METSTTLMGGKPGKPTMAEGPGTTVPASDPRMEEFLEKLMSSTGSSIPSQLAELGFTSNMIQKCWCKTTYELDVPAFKELFYQIPPKVPKQVRVLTAEERTARNKRRRENRIRNNGSCLKTTAGGWYRCLNCGESWPPDMGNYCGLCGGR